MLAALLSSITKSRRISSSRQGRDSPTLYSSIPQNKLFFIFIISFSLNTLRRWCFLSKNQKNYKESKEFLYNFRFTKVQNILHTKQIILKNFLIFYFRGFTPPSFIFRPFGAWFEFSFIKILPYLGTPSGRISRSKNTCYIRAYCRWRQIGIRS